MLRELRIQNFALIDKVNVEFHDGLNIISGETGAGKSIIIQAISLLLGGRASADWIQKGKEEALVEGVFDLESMPWIQRRLDQNGFESDEELLIKRAVNRQGKNRIWVNGELATRTLLQRVCEGLIDLCSQHEHQSLMQSQVQLRLLDQYGGLEGDRHEYTKTFLEYSEKREKLNSFFSDLEDYQQRVDFIKFQINELEQADLQPGEDLRLQKEKEFLKNSHSRIEAMNEVKATLEGGEYDSQGAIASLNRAKDRLAKLSGGEMGFDKELSHLAEALSLVEEVALALNRFLDQSDLDESRLEAVTDRLAMIAGLKRKYGDDIDQMIDFFEKKKEELRNLEEKDEIIERLQNEIHTLQKKVTEFGKNLSQKRQFAAKKLSQNVTRELKDLKMDDSLFKVEISLKPAIESWTKKGGNEISYLIQSNLGHDAKPLSKVASGGELSRIMLAFRRVNSDRGGIGVYLFDEIDTGMGGETAFVVGRKLKSVSHKHQVICITHLPQVAAYSDHHYVVRKSKVAGQTQTFLEKLENSGKKQEIARMLGGNQITPIALRNANELIRSASI